ncbi:PLDc N-terminal domain-containing protein [Chloroflexota bacterium]
MELEWHLALVLFSILHLALAIMLLHDLTGRKQVLGGRKAPWALAILFITFLGSLLYLLCHPKIFYDSDSK